MTQPTVSKHWRNNKDGGRKAPSGSRGKIWKP